MNSVDLAERMTRISRQKSWRLPIASATIPLAITLLLALVRRQVDLGTYLMGGSQAVGSHLYQVIFQPTGLGFTYPPFAAMLFVPLAHLPVRVDQVAFSWLNVAALFGLLAVSLRAVAPTLERRTLLWWALVLVLPAGFLDPIRETFLLGQVNLILAVLVIADMTLELPVPRGVLVGLAAAIKITPIILVPYLFLTRQTRSGWRALGTFVVIGAAAAAVSPQDSWTYWAHQVWNPSHIGPVAWIGNQGIIGVVERMMAHQLSTASAFSLVVPVSAVGLCVAALCYRQSSPLLGLVVVEATESIASPVSWSHHFVWIILLIAWLALASDRPIHGDRWAAGVALLFWAAPFWWVHHDRSLKYVGRGWLIPVADSIFFFLVAIVVAAAIGIVRQRAHSSPSKRHRTFARWTSASVRTRPDPENRGSY